jgi:hypothetical protein
MRCSWVAALDLLSDSREEPVEALKVAGVKCSSSPQQPLLFLRLLQKLQQDLEQQVVAEVKALPFPEEVEAPLKLPMAVVLAAL